MKKMSHMKKLGQEADKLQKKNPEYTLDQTAEILSNRGRTKKDGSPVDGKYIWSCLKSYKGSFHKRYVKAGATLDVIKGIVESKMDHKQMVDAITALVA